MRVAAGTSATITPPAVRDGRWVAITGRGFGHGVGMAQDGAYWMGRQGRTSAEILRLFYPGTALGTRGGNIRVPIGGAGVVTLTLVEGGTVNGRRIARGGTLTARPVDGELVATVTGTPGTSAEPAPGPGPVMVPIAFRSQAPSPPADITGTLAPPATAALVSPSTVEPTGAAVVVPGIDPGVPPPPSPEPAPVASSSLQPAEPATTKAANEAPPPAETTVAPGTLDTVRGNPLVVQAAVDGSATYAGKRYRGALELRAQGGVRVVNELDVEQYLRGMGEVTDAKWPAAALQAQAIAARTYAFRTMASAGEVCPTQRCQVYVGVKAEYPAMDAAVAATRGKVVTYAKGKLAVTFYSASGGGTIATPAEAFGGTGDFPYLQSGTYPTGDLKAWVVTMTIDEVGRRVGFGGTASHVEVTRVGPSGRAIEVTVSGDVAALKVSGPKFDAALGLRSTLFTLQQSDTPSIGSLGDVEVLSPSDPADPSDPSDEEGALTPVLAQTGFFETPSPFDDRSSPITGDRTGDDQAQPATGATTEPLSDTSSTATGVRSRAVAATPEPWSPTRQGQTSEVVFVGALTAVGATTLAAARRLRRARKGRLKPRT